jgi:hypothetical protein
MLLWNYYLCIFTDPGRVPAGWVRLVVSLSQSSDTRSRSPTFLLERDTKLRSSREAPDTVGIVKNTNPRGRIIVDSAIGW